MAPVRVVIVGTGAMGSLFAGRLARGGRAVVMLAGSWREALWAVAARGLTIEGDGGSFTTPVATALLSDTLGPADLVLVLVKSHATSAIAAPAAQALAPGGLLLTLQNGLGNREVLEAAAGPGGVGVGVATLGATLLGPGRVRAVPGRVTLGAEPRLGARLDAVAALFRDAGIPTDVVADVASLVWRKLAVNCAINPLSALRGVPNGALLEDAEARRLLETAAREVGAVASAGGIVVADDPAFLAVAVATTTAANRSSMLQDLDRGAPTEIDALCGAVVLEGRRLGVPTPVNEALWVAIKRREAHGTPRAGASRGGVARWSG
ncbi:MAG: ketopantoate reductase family protein [Acidobacteria bacterium]|nr:ketopantoate reductase family protein [Acidobacteriota bacterium]